MRHRHHKRTNNDGDSVGATRVTPAFPSTYRRPDEDDASSSSTKALRTTRIPNNSKYTRGLRYGRHIRGREAYTIPVSKMGLFATIRSKLKRDRSSVKYFLCKSSSDTVRPAAGDCIRPWPEKPVHSIMFLISE